MPLTTAQEIIIVDALKLETAVNVVTALANRDDVFLTNWLNGNATATNTWRKDVTSRDLFEAMDVTKFDALTAGKRDAWRLMLDFQPIDFSRQKNRRAVTDVWGATDGAPILTDCTRRTSRVEIYLTPDIAANQTTTAGVTGLTLSWYGPITLTELSMALNRNALRLGS
jgi:hypothetical protein